MGSVGLQESSDGGQSFRIVSQATGPPAMSPAFNNGDPRILIGSVPIMEYWADTGTTRPALIGAMSVYPIYPPKIALSHSYPDDPLIIMGAVRSTAQSGRNEAMSEPILESTVQRCDRLSCSSFFLGYPDAESPSVWLSNRFEQDGVAYASTLGGLFRSTDRALTFQRLTVPSEGFRFPLIWGVPIDLNGASGTNDLYVAVGDSSEKPPSLLRSIDDARSWASISPPDRLGRGGRLLTVTPSGRLLLAGNFGGLLCSEDDGATWEQRCSGEK